LSLFENAAPKYEDLVGEGKKYKTNDELIAAVLEKDALIEEALNKNKVLETDLLARKNLAEITDELRAAKKAEEIVEPTRQELGPKGEKPEVNLTEEVQKILAEERKRQSRTDNLTTAKAKLEEIYGGDYQKTLESVAKTLGVSNQFLEDLATSNPDGLIKVVSSTAKPEKRIDNTAPPVSRVGLPNTGNSVRKNNAYYRELRKADLNLYMDKRTQAEMHREAMEQGAAFFQ
jgi:hypothetical protein